MPCDFIAFARISDPVTVPINPSRSRRRCAVSMPEALARGNHVADRLLELRDLRKSLALVTRPHELPVGADLENAALAGDQRDFTDLGLERGQQLLRHPGRPQEPPALRTVLDLDACSHARAASLT